MQRITLTQAKPGMILAEPASGEQGTTVCGIGTELTGTLISRLENFGVTRLTVEGHPVQKKGDDKTLPELLGELDTRFSHVEDQPLTMELKAAFREQIHERMTEMAVGDDEAAPADPTTEPGAATSV